eukprot:c16812_g1_i1.p2 GENE.c16812_g1_i1~~c16812_g1_i1.p2  ORF type:complete len:170 (+),score=31.40 c16812_g1_i1:761-1270(+)
MFNERLGRSKAHLAGFNFYGQLGQGNVRPCAKIVNLPILERESIVSAAAGAHHTLLLTETGEVFAFGCNMNGELGVGSEEPFIAEPTLVSALMGCCVVQIACGVSHSVAITDKGEMYSWGGNSYGQLGLGNFVSVSEPQLVDRLPPASRVVKISCGSFHTAAVVETVPL